MDSFSQNFPAPIDNFAQIITDTLVTDTMGWYLLKGSFVADTSYNHIIIGNFFDNLNTDTFNLNNNSTGYYFVDDVCVSRDSVTCYSTVGINKISNSELNINVIYNNEEIVLENETGKLIDLKINIINLLGQSLFTKELKILNSYIIPFKNRNSSIYLISIQIKNNNRTFKFLKK